jgi:hypothetical protein
LLALAIIAPPACLYGFVACFHFPQETMRGSKCSIFDRCSRSGHRMHHLPVQIDGVLRLGDGDEFFQLFLPA